MLKIKIEGPRDKQVFIVEGTASIKSWPEFKKPVGRKGKWIYRPDNKKEVYEKNY